MPVSQIIKTYLLPLSILILGIVIGYSIKEYADNTFLSLDTEIRENGNYQYINPLLQCDMGHEYISKYAISPFDSKVSDAINKEKIDNNISFASVYFRDLNNGSWFGINENEKFRPASLLKVVIMIYYFRLEEQKPGSLDKQFVYNGEDLGLIQNFKPSHQVEIGKKYSIRELIKYMIKYSDNKATAKLYEMIDGNKFINIFSTFGIHTPTNFSDQEFLTIKQYASFFRVLFNASYVRDDLSEKALSLLTQTEFRDGIKGSIPGGVDVSNKFGEVILDSGVKELNDCGIVYYPKKPYLICIMTRGDDFSKMSKSIQKISKFVYDEVDRQVKEKSI